MTDMTQHNETTVCDDARKTEEQLFDKFHQLACYDREAVIMILDALDFVSESAQCESFQQIINDHCIADYMTHFATVHNAVAEALMFS